MASIKFNIVISYTKEAGDKLEEDHRSRTRLILGFGMSGKFEGTHYIIDNK